MSHLRRPMLQAAGGSRRLIAAGGVALVLLLSVLAVSPELHERFHHHCDHDGNEDACAVVLYTHGVSAPFDTAVLAATPVEWHALGRATTAEIFLTSPRYLHLPGRGPPVS